MYVHTEVLGILHASGLLASFYKHFFYFVDFIFVFLFFTVFSVFCAPKMIKLSVCVRECANDTVLGDTLQLSVQLYDYIALFINDLRSLCVRSECLMKSSPYDCRCTWTDTTYSTV